MATFNQCKRSNLNIVVRYSAAYFYSENPTCHTTFDLWLQIRKHFWNKSKK
jgi:hypothetical protein